MESSNNQNQTDTSKPRSLATIYEHGSWQSFKSLYFKLSARFTGTKSDKSWETMYKPTDEPEKIRSPAPPERLYKEFQITSCQVNGSNVYRLEPKQNKSSQVILYLHGGAYVKNSTIFHWNMIQQFIQNNNCTIIYPDYPLAPEASYVEGFQLLDVLYRQIVSEVDPKDLVLMGDSAGGGMSLAFTQKLKKEGVQLPSQLILLTPWLDISCTNQEMLEVNKYDPTLNINGLRKCGELWAKGIDVKDPLVSPVYGDVEGLPLISIFAGTHDVLGVDVKKFRDICDSKGVTINYFNYPKMVHLWMLSGFPESAKVIEQIGELLSKTK